MKVTRSPGPLNIRAAPADLSASRNGEGLAASKSYILAEQHETITMVDEHGQIAFAPGASFAGAGYLTPTGSYYDMLWDPVERRELAILLEEAREHHRQAVRIISVKPSEGRDGLRRWIEYKIVPFNASSYMISRKDVTNAKIEETISLCRSQLLESLGKHRSFSEALAQLINTIESIRSGMACLIALFGSTGNTLIETTVAPSLPASFIQSIPKEIIEDVLSASRQPVICGELDGPRWSFVADHGYHTSSVHAIFADSGAALGVFFACFRSSHTLTSSDIRIGEALSELAAVAISLQREFEHAGKALSRSEESMAVTLNSIGEGVIRTDENGRVVEMNFAMANLLGFESHAADGEFKDDSLHGDSQTRLNGSRPRKSHKANLHIGKQASSLLNIIQVFYPQSPTFQACPRTPHDAPEDPFCSPPSSGHYPALDSHSRESLDSSGSASSSSDTTESETTQYRAFYSDVEHMIQRAIEDRQDISLRDAADRILARPVDDPDVHDLLHDDIEHLLDDGDVNMGYLYRPHQTKQDVLPVQVTVSPLRQVGKGELKGSVIVVRDVSEVTKARLANRQLANKSRWFSVLSHEMRTPVNGVIGMLELLRRTKLSAEQKSLVNCMEVSANALLCLVSNVLDKSRLDSGKVTLELVSFSVKDRLKSFCDLMTMMAKNRRVNFTSEVDEDIPDVLYSDVNRLFQILLNLVSNALKFSGGRKHREGKVQLRVRLLETSSDVSGLEKEDDADDKLFPHSWEPESVKEEALPGHLNPFEVAYSPGSPASTSVQLLFEVIDNGIGISPENLRKLFKEFGQAEASTSRRYGGSGMGLFICKQLVALFNGHIGCESELGKGSRFYFTAWFRRSDAELSPESSASASPSIVPDAREFFVAESQQMLGGLPGDHFAPDADENGMEMEESDPNDAQKSLVDLQQPYSDGRRRMTKDQTRILVADDDVICQQVLGKFLEALGFRHVDVVGDGKQALQKCRKRSYTFILMDSFMPIMDGLEAAGQVVDEHTTKVASWQDSVKPPTRPVIIAITGDVDVDAERLRHCGVGSHLTKPIRMKQLMAELEKYVEFVEL